MSETFDFLLMAYRAYRMAKRTGNVSYVSISRRGIPYMSCFVGVGREAWRISQRAIEEFAPIEEKP